SERTWCRETRRRPVWIWRWRFTAHCGRRGYPATTSTYFHTALRVTKNCFFHTAAIAASLAGICLTLSVNFDTRIIGRCFLTVFERSVESFAAFLRLRR